MHDNLTILSKIGHPSMHYAYVLHRDVPYVCTICTIYRGTTINASNFIQKKFFDFKTYVTCPL